MPISSQCPSCFKAIQLPDGSYGKKVRCGACKHVFVIDEPPIEEPAAAEEPPVVVAPAPVEPVAVVAADEVAGFTEKAGTLPKKPAKTPPPLKKMGPPKAQSDRDDNDKLERKKKKKE